MVGSWFIDGRAIKDGAQIAGMAPEGGAAGWGDADAGAGFFAVEVFADGDVTSNFQRVQMGGQIAIARSDDGTQAGNSSISGWGKAAKAAMIFRRVIWWMVSSGGPAKSAMDQARRNQKPANSRQAASIKKM